MARSGRGRQEETVGWDTFNITKLLLLVIVSCPLPELLSLLQADQWWWMCMIRESNELYHMIVT